MEENVVKNEVTNNNSNKNVIIAVLIMIIIALISVVIYFVFIKKDDKPVNNENKEQQETINQNSEEKDIIIKKENYTEYKNNLKKYSDVNINENDDSGFLQYSISQCEVELLDDGTIKITKDDNTSVTLSNITNGKALQGDSGYFYILLDNGEVYYYDSERFYDGNYTAIKLKNISNITKFVKSGYCVKEENFCVDELGIVDKDDMYIELESLIP